MGLAASQARLLVLTARKSELELTDQQINQSRMQLSNVVNELFNVSSNLDPNSPASIQLQLRINALQGVDKGLELQQKRIETQHDAIQTELDAVKKIITKNIESTFKTFG